MLKWNNGTVAVGFDEAELRAEVGPAVWDRAVLAIVERVLLAQAETIRTALFPDPLDAVGLIDKSDRLVPNDTRASMGGREFRGDAERVPLGLDGDSVVSVGATSSGGQSEAVAG